MGPVSASITIDAPRERVWELICDLATRPAFCDHFQLDYRLQRIESRGIGASARFRTEAKRFPIWLDTTIVELDPPYRLLERGRGGRANRMAVGTAWELVEGPGETTEATVSFWTEPAHPFDAVRGRLGSERWYERQLKKALQRLRELAETGAAPEPLQVGGTTRI
jgi:uncharacterized protein YndB with AHSA1/START domain